MVDVAALCAAYRTPYTGSGGAFSGLDGLDFAEVVRMQLPARSANATGPAPLV